MNEGVVYPSGTIRKDFLKEFIFELGLNRWLGASRSVMCLALELYEGKHKVWNWNQVLWILLAILYFTLEVRGMHSMDI